MEQLSEQEILLAQSSPAGFAAVVNPKFSFPAHVELINTQLVKLARGEIERLLVEVPPRHGKSELISLHFTAWYMCTFPDRRVIVIGYGSDFAERWGRGARELVREWGEAIWGVRIDPAVSAAKRWKLEGTNGIMETTGLFGQLTGKGADLMIIDDPIKSSEDADSQAQKDKLWDWYLSTSRTRLHPGGGLIVVQTRWAEDDLIGRIINNDANEIIAPEL